MQFARVVFASGRDRAWPGPISDALSHVFGSTGAPSVATIVVGVLATALCLQGTLALVVTFTAVLIITLYALIAISALVSRVRQRDRPRPFAMPFWPVPPAVALVGVVVALTQQKVSDLLIVAGIFVVGLIYYYGFLAPRGDRYWRISSEPAADLEPRPALERQS